MERSKVKQAILLSSILVSLCCCCSWGGFVKGLSEVTTTETAVSADEFLTAMFRSPTVAPSDIKNFQGAKTESPGFTNYYLRYDNTFAKNDVTK